MPRKSIINKGGGKLYLLTTLTWRELDVGMCVVEIDDILKSTNISTVQPLQILFNLNFEISDYLLTQVKKEERHTKASVCCTTSTTSSGIAKSVGSSIMAPKEEILWIAVLTASIISGCSTYLRSKKNFLGTPSRRPENVALRVN